MRAIEIKKLHYKYPDGTMALRGVDLRIESGESVYLIGPNGSGKSTLLLHLNGIIQPQQGQVLILGMDMRKKTREVKSKVGLVFQNPDDQLFMPTVFEDVAFGPVNMKLGEKEIKIRVKKALKAVGLEGFEGRSSHHLSYGEKKRVAIATVLSMDPEILVLDEPTLSLDPWIKNDFMKLLKELGKGHTLLISGHDLDLMKLCDRTYLLNNGKITRKISKKCDIFKKTPNKRNFEKRS